MSRKSKKTGRSQEALTLDAIHAKAQLCPIANIARETETVLRALMANDATKTIEPFHQIQQERHCDRLNLELDALLEQSSYMLTEGAQGALFQLLAAHGRFDVINSELSKLEKERAKRFIGRCIFSVLRYLEKSAEPLPKCREYFASTDLDPHTKLARELMEGHGAERL